MMLRDAYMMASRLVSRSRCSSRQTMPADKSSIGTATTRTINISLWATVRPRRARFEKGVAFDSIGPLGTGYSTGTIA
jgi:hypothetical protein